MTGEGVNIPLLRKAVEWAECEAAKPEQDSAWAQEEIVASGQELGRSCGTCYCVAGFIAMTVVGEHATADNAIDIALDALNVTVNDLGGLFSVNNTIEDVRRIAESLAGERL